MPPTLDEVMETIEKLHQRTPERITASPYLATLVMRDLRTSTPYVHKCLDQLEQAGRIKRLSMAPSGVVSLSADERQALCHALPYFHPGDAYAGARYGRVTLKYRDQNLWSGNGQRSYYLPADAWGELFAELTREAEERRAKEREEREVERALENAALEELVPGYAEVRAALETLVPGAGARFTVLDHPDRRNADDPRLYVHVDRLTLRQLAVLVDLVRRGLAQNS